MDYDRDLKWVRRATFLMFGFEIGIAFTGVRRHQWLLAATTVCWVGAMLMGLWYLRIAQGVRDNVRILLAMLHKHQHENDRGRRWKLGGHDD